MLAYIVIILVSVALALATEIVEKKTNKKWLVIILIICTILFPAIIAGIRYEVGTDDIKVYKSIFESAKEGIYINRGRKIEVGYILLNKLVIFMNGNYNVVIFLASLITISFTYLGIRHYKDKISTTLAWFFFLILFYQRSFNLVRQMMAVAIVFFGFRYLDIRERKEDEEKKKYILYYLSQTLKYTICVLIATTFHTTALMMLIAIFLRPIYSNSKYKYISLATFVILLTVILNFKAIYNFTVQTPLFQKYATYFRTIGKTRIGLTYLIKLVIPCIVPYFFMIKNIQKDKEMSMLFCFTVLSTILYLLGYLTNTHGERIAHYFQISEIILFPFYIKGFYENWKDKKNIYIPIITAFLTLNIGIWYNDYIRKNMDETIPYRTIFQKNIIDKEIEKEDY